MGTFPFIKNIFCCNNDIYLQILGTFPLLCQKHTRNAVCKIKGGYDHAVYQTIRKVRVGTEI